MSNKLFPRSIKCKRPKFSNHAGKCWESCEVYDTNGVKHEGWLEIVYGNYFYFMYDNQYYKAKFSNFDNPIENIFDFRKVGKMDYKMTFIPDNKEKVS